MTEQRQWQTGDDLKIDAQTLMGEERKYIFKELNQEHGSEIFHRHVMMLVDQWGKLKELVEEFKRLREEKKSDGEEISVKSVLDQAEIIAGILPRFFSWEEIKRLASRLLSDHTVEIGEDKYVSGEDGFSDVKGDPLEIYHAIAFSMLANWPKYLLPLLGTVLSDSTQDSEPEHKQNDEPAK